MDASGDVAVVEDLRFRAHSGPPDHPERPDRLIAVSEAIAERAGRLTAVSPRPATPEEILRVHDRAHLEHVARVVGRAPAQLDPDTYVSSESLDVALLAAGGAVDLARRVARGAARCGLAAVRPPGHHAESGRAMGFCLFNNAAIAARALQAEEGVGRILLLDWDVHHGNGTQHCFDEDPTVLYVSTHQFPYYPGTGDFGECGVGRGVGSTVNIPLPAGCGDAEYVGALQRVLVPVARRFDPEMIVVSAGFDAHRDDPLAQMQVGAVGFGGMSDIVRALADDLCGGRVVFVLEGGYAARGLREGTGALLDSMLAPGRVSPPEPAPLAPGSVLDGVLSRVRAVHARSFPDLGAP
jgi:acetoin utilization deacetylase AcuC-like enzyme